ncbi:MAG: hypothetical protein KatS3mg043_0829 [Rhodothermaceae bacterium]|nr:MAG: hypothetical protein KatS3mg043_0829 [Rhodothermaceae bacterium]
MVTATLDPFAAAGSRLDVTLSALGDARSLSGGLLLQTPLLDPTTGTVYAMAQGPVSTGAVLASSFGSSVQVNHTNTGRIPGGAFLTKTPPFDLSAVSDLGLVLKRPDFTNAVRVAEAINARFPGAAEVAHAGPGPRAGRYPSGRHPGPHGRARSHDDRCGPARPDRDQRADGHHRGRRQRAHRRGDGHLRQPRHRHPGRPVRFPAAALLARRDRDGSRRHGHHRAGRAPARSSCRPTPM